jgi:uncharacterized protein YkwD
LQRLTGIRIPVAVAALAMAVALLCAGATTASAARCENVRVTPAEDPAAAHDATLCLLNRERATHGLRPLEAHDALGRAARGHSSDMVSRRYFAHTAPGNVTFIDRIRRAKYNPRGGWSVGENLAWGSGSLATPVSIVAGWMRSPGHRSNILNGSFRTIGIGIARGIPVNASAAVARSGATYTTDFGSR